MKEIGGTPVGGDHVEGLSPHKIVEVRLFHEMDYAKALVYVDMPKSG